MNTICIGNDTCWRKDMLTYMVMEEKELVITDGTPRIVKSMPDLDGMIKHLLKLTNLDKLESPNKLDKKVMSMMSNPSNKSNVNANNANLEAMNCRGCYVCGDPGHKAREDKCHRDANGKVVKFMECTDNSPKAGGVNMGGKKNKGEACCTWNHFPCPQGHTEATCAYKILFQEHERGKNQGTVNAVVSPRCTYVSCEERQGHATVDCPYMRVDS